jgi:hypothetical protein
MLGTSVYCFVEIQVYILVCLLLFLSVCMDGLNNGLLFRMGDVVVLILIPRIINFCVWDYVYYMNFFSFVEM